MENKIDADVQKEIASLQVMEQRANTLGAQKQNFQSQLIEAENALGEMEKSEETFKIVGGIIVKKDREELRREIGEKVDDLKAKIESYEKEEKRVRDKLEAKQEELMSKIK